MSRAASGSTAVLEYRPTETLALLFAGCLAPRCLSRPCRSPSPPKWRKTGAFPETRVKSQPRRTLCGRGLDSNFQFRAGIGFGFRLADGHRSASACWLGLRRRVTMIEFE